MNDPVADLQKVADLGGPVIPPSEQEGDVTEHGVTLHFKQAPGSVAITLVKHPWIVPEGTIWSQVDHFFGV